MKLMEREVHALKMMVVVMMFNVASVAHGAIAIDCKKSECDGTDCMTCKQEVASAEHRIQDNPKICEDRKLGKKENESCIMLRGNLCYTRSELSSGNWLFGRHKCCMILQLDTDNKGSVCEEGGTYECHHDNHPVCNCPAGRKGKTCAERSTEMARCSCFKDTYKIKGCGEDCDSKDKGHDWETCQLHISGYNCVCNKVKAEDIDSLEDMKSCSSESFSSMKISGGSKTHISILTLTVTIMAHQMLRLFVLR